MSPITTIQTVDFSKSEQYTLSIRINTDGFSFSIFNPLADNPYTFFDLEIDKNKSLIANFKEKVINYPFLSQLYKRVNILIGDTKSALHPSALFEPDMKEELYFYGQKLLNTHAQVLYNNIESSKQTVIFSVNKSLYKFINEHFTSPRFYSQVTPLLAYFTLKSKEGNTQKLFVQLQNDSIQLYAFNKGKLFLTNSFSTSEISNQVYYVLYIWKQLNLNQEKDELFLSGSIDEKKELIELLKKYIKIIHLIDQPEFIDLKAMNICEL